MYTGRDIKPENILFDEGILKLADFGLALNSNEEHAVTRAGKSRETPESWGPATVFLLPAGHQLQVTFALTVHVTCWS